MHLDTQKSGYQPNLRSYPDPKYDVDTFTIIACFKVESIQFWRDKPLYVGKMKPILYDALAGASGNYQKSDKFEEIINTNNIKNYLNQLSEVDESAKFFRQGLLDIVERINNTPLPDEPPQNSNSGSASSTTASSEPTFGIIKEVSFSDAISSVSGSSNFTEFKDIDKEITDRVLKLDNIDDLIDVLEDIENTYPPLVQDMRDFANMVPPAQIQNDEFVPPNLENIYDSVENLGAEQEMWYGIPLINLGPDRVDISKNIIVQIDTKREWKINVLNLLGIGNNTARLEVDVTPPPGSHFVVALNIISKKEAFLLVKLEGDETLYSSSIRLPQDIDLHYLGIGGDNNLLKTLCGEVCFLYYIPNDNQRTNPPNPPEDSGSGGGAGEIKAPDFYRYIPQIRGNLLEIGPLKLYDGYASNFFCNREMKIHSFTIQWWINLQTRIKITEESQIITLIADDIHNNFLKYDLENYYLIFEFNGLVFKERFTIPTFDWSQFVLMYDKNSGILSLHFTEIYWSDPVIFEFDIGTDLEFSITSLNARMDRFTGEILEKAPTFFGNWEFHDEILDSDALTKIYNKYKNILKYYDINSTILLN
jgi:hypothetical protein